MLRLVPPRSKMSLQDIQSQIDTHLAEVARLQQELTQKREDDAVARRIEELSSLFPVALKKIPCISLIDANPKVWKPNWFKCFDRPVKDIKDVKIGDTGSIGAAYNVYDNLEVLFEGCPDAKTREKKLLSTPRVLHSGKKMTWSSARPLAEFYTFSQEGQVYFIVKQGATGLWLCKKTSNYYHAPPADRATESLVSDHQKSSGYYEHRFSFVVTRFLTPEEANLDRGYNARLIVMQNILMSC